MQVLVTHGVLSRTRVFQFNGFQLGAVLAVLALVLMLASGAIYHFVFLKAAREGWPVVSSLVKLIVRDEIAQRDRVMRDNLDAMAQRVGEVYAKMVRLEAMGERLMVSAGVKVEGLKALPSLPALGGRGAGGKGGPFIAAISPAPGLDELNGHLAVVDDVAEQHGDVFILVESRMLAARMRALMIPSVRPVEGGVGSGFGFRVDPISGRGALHSGLDFPGEVGAPILAAAGGLVVANEWHAAYGQVLEIDHGNGLVTRYAHCSRVLVEVGALVKQGQRVAEVGSTGRSTGPHLHFEVLLDGVPQDPARFLEGRTAPTTTPGAALRR